MTGLDDWSGQDAAVGETMASGARKTPIVRTAATLLAGLVFVGALRADEPPVPADGGGVAAVAARRARVLAFVNGARGEFAKVLRMELNHLRTACPDLSPAVRRSIRKAGEAAAEEAILRQAEAIVDFESRAAAPAPDGGFDGDCDALQGMDRFHPVVAVREALARALVEQVGPERARAHLDGLAWREEKRREAAVKRFLLTFDEAMRLSSEQWDAIEQALLEAWDERIEAATDPGWREVVVDRRRSWAGVRYDPILPHLDQAQRELLALETDEELEWRAIQAWLVGRLLQVLPEGLEVAEDPWWHE